MKMTMHIDDALLSRVMEAYGCVSKTETVEMALAEMDRRTRFKAFVKEGLGLTPDELAEGVDPDYDVHGLRAAESSPGYTAKGRRPKSKRK